MLNMQLDIYFSLTVHLTDTDPQQTVRLVLNWLKNNKVSFLEWPSQRPYVAQPKSGPTNLTKVHQFCLEE